MVTEMEVNYTLEEQDWRRLVRQLERNLSLSPRRALWFMPTMMLVIFLLSPAFRRVLWLSQQAQSPLQLAGIWATALLPIPILMSLCSVAFWMIRRRTFHDLQHTPFWQQPHFTALTPQYLHNRDGQGETKYFWAAMHEVIADDLCIYLLITQRTGYVVPKRAFANAEQAQQFYETARGYWQTSRNEKATPPIPHPS